MSKAYSNKALPPGTVLREWRLEQVLGVGGFGIVYKGRGIYFDELVAIKEYFPSSISDRKDGDTVVPSDSAAEEVHALGLKKFVEEAKLLWNLSKPTRHPNIVSVRSLFEIHGTAYMVMDFEDGVPLSDLIKKRKKFSEGDLLGLIRPMGEGLERAHRVGVLHRDIKPANILIKGDGEPVLIDFGSARFDSGQATSTKVTFHTPPYAAIEQYVKTYQQGPWTDIYALGVVLFECVTGTKPAEVLERMHGGLDHPLAEGDWPDFSRAFLRAVDAAMTIRPSDRPRTISQWLSLFEDENAPFGAEADADEAPTRFAAFERPEIVPLVPTPTLSASGAATVKLKQPPKADEPKEEVRSSEKVVAEAMSKVTPPKEPDEDEEEAKSSEAMSKVAPPKEPAKATDASHESAKAAITGRQAAIAGGLLAVAAVGGTWMFWPNGRSGSSQDTLSGPATAGPSETAVLGPAEGQAPAADGVSNAFDNNVAAAAAPVDIGRVDNLAPAIDALARDARSAGRGGDAARLAATSGRLRSLAAEAKAAAAQPGSEAVVKAKIDQMNALARVGASALAQSVRRDAEAKGKSILSAMGSDPTNDGKTAAAVLRNVRNSAGAAASSASPGQAIAAARRTLLASRQLAAIHPKAAVASTLPKKREEFAGIASSVRSTAADVAAMGKAKKPPLFASKQRRDDYRLRQSNAAEAQAELTRLEQLQAAVGAVTTAAAADSAIKQAKAIQAKLHELETSSKAAMPVDKE
jgi:non-specific serine/threonine protein kinase